MSGRKVFTAGEVLQAADVNDYLMDQSVMVFAGTAARGSAIGTPTEGMVTYLEDSDELQVYTTDWGAVGVSPAILQVVSTSKTDTFSASVASGASSAITGLSASITPSSTSSKVLVVGYVSTGIATIGGVEQSVPPGVILKRGATAISIGDAASNRARISGASFTSDGPQSGNNAIIFLDSPSTTSSTTYSFDIFNTMANTNTLYVNRSATDTDLARFFRTASSITLMEVAG